MALTIYPTTEGANARQTREDEVREWFAVACDSIRHRDREGLRFAAHELANRGVNFTFTADFLDREVRP
jgi:hypothetical protein